MAQVGVKVCNLQKQGMGYFVLNNVSIIIQSIENGVIYAILLHILTMLGILMSNG